MVRSNLTRKFTPKAIHDMQKQYRSDYKKENDKELKGNVMIAVTLGVIQAKGYPELEDEIRLIKAGNGNCTNDDAYQIFSNYMEVEENRKRGLVGVHDALCKDLVIDGWALDETTADLLSDIEGLVKNRLKEQEERRKQLEKIGNMTELFKGIKNNKELGVEADTQETK